MLRVDFTRVLPGQAVPAKGTALNDIAPVVRTQRANTALRGGARVVTLVSLAIPMATLAGMAVVKIGLDRQQSDLSARIERQRSDSIALAANVTAAMALRQEDSLYSVKIAAIREMDSNRFVWPHIMSALGRATPRGVWLVDVREGSSQTKGVPVVRIKGAAIGVEPVTEFLRRLQQEAHFHTPRFIGASPERVGADATTFTIEAEYRPELRAMPDTMLPDSGLPPNLTVQP